MHLLLYIEACGCQNCLKFEDIKFLITFFFKHTKVFQGTDFQDLQIKKIGSGL